MVKLKRIYLKQSVAGKGVGAALMKTILDEVERRAYNTLWLTVWEHNVHAQGFYRKWGFEACGFIDFPLGSVVMTDLLMQRKIDS